MKSFLLFFAAIFIGFATSNAQSDIQYKITVNQDGTGDFTTIQAAIDASKAFPDKPITIYIKNGLYNEKVHVPSWNNKLSLIGENPEKTIISWNDYFAKINRGRNSTFYTWTLLIEADDFYAENLSIVNSAGKVGQAVALHVEGDRCIFKNCRMLGNQDTIYLNGEKSRQFFSNCTIEGTTDFIFGSATALFQKCKIRSKSNSYLTAANTTPHQNFGFVFIECDVQASNHVTEVYLGRPWRNYAKTVFLKCHLGKHIKPEGWHNWNKVAAEANSFYAEYKNTGEGAKTKNRVAWSHQLTDEEAKTYTPQIILGDWILSYLTPK